MVGNDAVGRVDFLGFQIAGVSGQYAQRQGSAQNQANPIDVQREELQKLLLSGIKGDSCISKHTNIKEVIRNMVSMLGHGLTASASDDATDKFQPVLDHVTHSNTPQFVFHEMTHAWAHLNTDLPPPPFFGYDKKIDRMHEGLGWAASTLMTALESFSGIEINVDGMTCDEFAKKAKHRVRLGMKNMESFKGQLNDDNNTAFTGGVDDFKRLSKMLGFRFDCKGFIQCVNSRKPGCECQTQGTHDALNDGDCPDWILDTYP